MWLVKHIPSNPEVPKIGRFHFFSMLPEGLQGLSSREKVFFENLALWIAGKALLNF